jgi:hypothetical protein
MQVIFDSYVALSPRPTGYRPPNDIGEESRTDPVATAIPRLSVIDGLVSVTRCEWRLPLPVKRGGNDEG